MRTTVVLPKEFEYTLATVRESTVHRANSTNALVQVVPRVSQRIMAPTSMPSTCMPEAVSPLGTGKRRKISIMASDMINHS